MIARRFLYVGAGLACLALVYHVGAQSARAQSSGIEAADVTVTPYSTLYTCVVGRTFHYTNAPPAEYTVAADVPGASPIVETGSDGIYLTAILADGDIYQWDGSAWLLRGSLLGGPTAARSQSWGAMRVRYRAAAQQNR
jgi:hypothetical protein